MSKNDFKMFVRDNPKLATHVNSGTMTWQKFYDMFALYGDNNNIWNEYLNNTNTNIPVSNNQAVTENTTIKDLIGMVKRIDLSSVQKGIDGVQKTISLIQGLGSSAVKEGYTPRPIYQHLDD